MVKKMKKNVIIFFNHLIMKCILKNKKKSTLSLFDDKRCDINETESKP